LGRQATGSCDGRYATFEGRHALFEDVLMEKLFKTTTKRVRGALWKRTTVGFPMRE
jgi:hypothetical protein